MAAASQLLVQLWRGRAAATVTRLATPVLRQPRRRFASFMVDGRPEAPVVSAHDLTFVRGDGAFEVVSLLPSPHKASHGVPVGMNLHIDRLEATCKSLRLAMPHTAEQIAAWVGQMGREEGPGGCRIVVTRGQPSKGVGPKVLLLHDPPAKWPTRFSMKSMEAPWHFGYALPPLQNAPAYSEKVDIDAWKTIKWMSYAPNCLMTRIAEEHGADDALLVAADGRVLDGPNFAVGFVLEGRIRLIHPGANRMLPSCTQTLVLQAAAAAGLPLEEGVVTLGEARRADAAFAMSATRHVLPISSLDGRELQSDHELVRRLADAYWQQADAEVLAALQ